MTVAHHPTDETLMRHAAGTLGAAPAIVVGAHLSVCPQCRDSVRTFEALGGAVLRIRHACTGAGSLRDQVLRDPEGGVAAIRLCFQSLNAAALLAFGIAAWRLTRSLPASIAAQILPVAPWTCQFNSCVVAPEPLLIGTTLCLCGVTLAALSRDGPVRPRFARRSGLIVGLGLALKVTVAPIALVPLWGLRGRRRWLSFGIAALSAFVLGILPILGQLGDFAAWLWHLFLGSGPYGTTSEGYPVVNPAKYASDLATLVRAEPLAVAVFAASAALLAHTRLRRGEALADVRAATFWRVLALCTAAEALQFLLVAKHPEQRYLLPALSMTGLNLIAGLMLFRTAYPRRTARRLTLAGALALTVALAWTGRSNAIKLHDKHAFADNLLRMHAEAIRDAERTGDTLVYFYGSSSLEYGLYFADFSAGYRYEDDLRALYPRTMSYNVWAGRFELDGRAVPEEEAARALASERLVFQGPSYTLPKGIAFTALRKDTWEGLFRAAPPRE